MNSLINNNPPQLQTIIVKINKIIFINEVTNEFISSLVDQDLNHSLFIVVFTLNHTIIENCHGMIIYVNFIFLLKDLNQNITDPWLLLLQSIKQEGIEVYKIN